MKFLKIFLITIIFVNSAVSIAFANDTTTEQSPSKPALKMGGNNTYSLEAGKSTEVTIPIVNSSADNAYDVLIQAKTGENSPLNISFKNSSNRTNNILRGGSHNVVMDIDVDKNATTGKYPITLEYSFTSSDKQSFTGSDTFYVKVDNGSLVPTVALNNLKVSKDNVVFGDSFDITATLQNISGIEASNVNVEIVSLEENNMTVVGGTSNILFAKMDTNTTQDIAFKLATTSLTKEGANKITIKVTYNDFSGKEYSKEYFTYVNVSKTEDSTSGSANLKITNVVAPTGTFNVGQTGTFKVKVKNQSKVTAKNIKASVKVPEGIVPTSSNTIFIDELLANEEKEVAFNVAPTSSATTQTYTIGFSIEYNNGSKTTNTTDTTTDSVVIEQYAGFNVNNPDPKKEGEETKTSVPKIIVSKYETNPTIVEAGKSFTLSMNFKNTHENKIVKNIKIYLTIEDKTEEKGNVFAPDNSSTTYFIDSIAPKQEVSHTFNLFAVPDASPRSYTVNVNLEYEDENANEYKSTELVGVNVKQQANLELSEITKQDVGMVGEPMNINFQLYNTGKVTLSNLMIKLEGEGVDTSSATSFIGNFEPGSTEYYDNMFIPLEAGEKTVNLIITYNDTDGKEVEKIEEITFFVDEMIIPEDTDISQQPLEPEKKFPTKAIGIVCVIVFVIGISIFIFVKKAKAKKEFDFND